MRSEDEPTIFTYSEACELLPKVRQATQGYAEEVGDLQKILEDEERPLEERRRARETLEKRFDEWTREMMDLGVYVKGLWTVDFDSGDGFFYCWNLGEETLEFMHRYEETFKDRRPIMTPKSQPDAN